MSPDLTLLTYIGTAVVALLAIVLLGSKAWYLHLVSIFLALIAGLMPPIGGDPELFYTLAGTAFTFFLTWGVVGIVFRRSPARLERHSDRRAGIPLMRRDSRNVPQHR
jgi:hypothetical protein